MSAFLSHCLKKKERSFCNSINYRIKSIPYAVSWHGSILRLVLSDRVPRICCCCCSEISILSFGENTCVWRVFYTGGDRQNLIYLLVPVWDSWERNNASHPKLLVHPLTLQPKWMGLPGLFLLLFLPINYEHILCDYIFFCMFLFQVHIWCSLLDLDAVDLIRVTKGDPIHVTLEQLLMILMI